MSGIHLLRLFDIMTFSMFSCSHFSNFLSDPIRNQSAMSKRGQKTTSSEGSPMAKPRPMNSAMAKSRPMNLVMHNPLSARKKPPQDLNNPVNPWNVEREQGGDPGFRTLMRIHPVRMMDRQSASSCMCAVRRASRCVHTLDCPEGALDRVRWGI